VDKTLGFTYLSISLFLAIYSQLIIKWRVVEKIMSIPIPHETMSKVGYLFSIIFDPFIFSGLIATFVAGLFWMATMTKFDISYAYPFTMISYVFVTFFAIAYFNEPFSWFKVLGLAFIIFGVLITCKFG